MVAKICLRYPSKACGSLVLVIDGEVDGKYSDGALVGGS